MATINGWIFVIIGGAVAGWSAFMANLTFFIYIGAGLAAYGLAKVAYTALTKDKASASPGAKGQPSRADMLRHTQAASHHAQQHHFVNQHHAQTHPMHMQHAQRMQQPAVRVCPNCHQQIHAGYRFCPHCGWGV